MNILLRIYHYVQPETKQDEIGGYIMTGGIVVLIIGSLIYLFRREYKSSPWEEGLIPDSFKPTRANLMEIYISAACAVIKRDPERMYSKFGMINNYMLRYFRDEYYDFTDSYSFSLKHLVKINSLAQWCNKHLDTKQKIQLLNFLVELAVDDGTLHPEEKRYIFALIQKLNLTFDAIDLRYKPAFEEQKQERKTTSASNSHSPRKRFFEILGIPETATAEEIKTTYRKLVKITHPDRFMNEPPEVQEKMKRKFQEIQEAYEQVTQ